MPSNFNFIMFRRKRRIRPNNTKEISLPLWIQMLVAFATVVTSVALVLIAIEQRNDANDSQNFQIQIGRLRLIKSIKDMDDSVAVTRVIILKTGNEIKVDSVYHRILNMISKVKQQISDEVANPYFFKREELHKYWVALGDDASNIIGGENIVPSLGEGRLFVYERFAVIRMRIENIKLFLLEKLQKKRCWK